MYAAAYSMNNYSLFCYYVAISLAPADTNSHNTSVEFRFILNLKNAAAINSLYVTLTYIPKHFFSFDPATLRFPSNRLSYVFKPPALVAWNIVLDSFQHRSSNIWGKKRRRMKIYVRKRTDRNRNKNDRAKKLWKVVAIVSG